MASETPQAAAAVAQAGTERPADYVAQCEAARVKLVEALDAAAAWAHSQKLYLQRDETYAQILELEPDHKEARRFLGYRWDKKSASWIKDESARPAKDRNDELVPESKAQRAAAFEAWVGARLEAIDRFAEALGKSGVQAELKALVKLAPDDDRLRARRGEVRVGTGERTRWILAETAEALERRQAMEQKQQALLAQFPAANTVEASAVELGLGVPWKSVVQLPRVVVLSDVGAEEAQRVARHVQILWDWLETLLGPAPAFPEDLRIYLVGENKSAFLAAYPDLSTDRRQLFGEVSSAWLVQPTRLGTWNGDEKTRVDHAVRQVISWFLYSRDGIAARHGWAEQGFGVYLTDRMLGTHRSFAVMDEEGSGAGRRDFENSVHNDEADFLTLARDIMRDGNPAALASALGRSVNSMTSNDLLLSYALAAYLVESQGSEACVRVLARTGKDESPVLVLESELSFPLPDLWERLERWLVQVTR